MPQSRCTCETCNVMLAPGAAVGIQDLLDGRWACYCREHAEEWRGTVINAREKRTLTALAARLWEEEGGADA